MNFDFGALVFDRTQADVDARNSKGTYNTADLNRVGEAVAYIRDLFLEYGYTVTVSPHAEWAETDIPTQADMAAYLQNVVVLQDLIVFSKNPPKLPNTLHGLSFQTANKIEKLLHDLGVAAEKIPASWYQSGQIESGVAYT